MSDSHLQLPWSVLPVDQAAATRLAEQTGLSTILSRILIARGIDDSEKVERFLSPSLARDWLSPSLIPGMDAAAQKVTDAVSSSKRIVVFGDFDLDGISATAVAARGLRALGGDVFAVVPRRFDEGYGLSAAAIERVQALHPDLVVTVDTGISSSEEVAVLLQAGVDVVVTDHHEPGGLVPGSIPVANPKLDPACLSRGLSGSGVALKLVQAVGSLLGHDVWTDLVDLAMLGTVADVVPLTGENRALVAAGVLRCRADARTCVAALAAVAGVSLSGFTSDSVAFSLAPRLNAAGRMSDPAVALDLLMTDDPTVAEQLAVSLDEQNRMRQSIEADLMDAARALAKRVYHGERGIVLAGEGWHEGVKGIAASRFVGEYQVPSILFSIEDGMARGSGRSIGNVDLFRAVESCSDLLERFGGHSAAVGLTLRADRLEEFQRRLLGYLDALPQEMFDVTTTIDAQVTLDQLGADLAAQLSLLEPFGHANRRPLLAVSHVFMNGRSKVGKSANHLKFTAYDGVASVPAIAFRCRDIDSLAEQDTPIDIAFELDVNEWRGRRRAQMLVREFRGHEIDSEAPSAALVEDLFDRADEILAREEYAGIEDAPSFHTKLAGVTFEGRQDALERLTPGTPLRLVRQPENPYDPNACALFEPRGAQVGFLNRRLAAVLAHPIDEGVEYDVEVTEVTGGDGERTSHGVNVLLTRRDMALDAEEDAEQRQARRSELSALPEDELDTALIRAFIGDGKLHEAQARSLASLTRGKNTLTVMATGRGKSLIFHLHAARLALKKGTASVFVYPLRALVADQSFHLDEVFSAIGLAVRTVTGETSLPERDEAFADLESGRLDVVLTTPEFLQFHAARFAKSDRIGFVVVDEAHHVGLSRAGNRPAYARLGDALSSLGSPTVLAVTATAGDEVATLIESTLSIDEVVLDPTVRENLRVEDRRAQTDKDGYLCSIAASGDKMVVYVNSRDKTVQIARMLRKRVPEMAMRVAFYNGGLSRSMRHAIEHAFRAGDVRIVIATSAFGEGVNIPDIRHVVLYHLPFNSVEFNQMAGRAGRDGALARIHLLFGEKDARINRAILASLAPARDDLATLYRVLRELQRREGPGFEITNAELAERCHDLDRQCRLTDSSVSAGIGVFRDLGLVTGEGHGAYRRLALLPTEGGLHLTESVRYAEGLDEMEQFEVFVDDVLSADEQTLLKRFDRPILPNRV